MPEETKEKNFDIPYGIFIDIFGAPNPQSTRYKVNAYGESIIEVYRSLDHGNTDFHGVEHVIQVGTFKLSDLENCSVKDFLERIRKGIEEKLSNPKE